MDRRIATSPHRRQAHAYRVPRVGLDPAFIGLLLTIAAGSGLLTMLASGQIADRVGRKGLLMASLLLTGLILHFVFFAPHGRPPLSLTMVLYGLAIGFHGPIAAWAADLAQEGGVGTALGVYRRVADLGWVAGPLLLGYLGEAFARLESNIWPFAAASIWVVFFGLLLFPARDPVGQGRAAAPVPANGGSQGSGGGGST